MGYTIVKANSSHLENVGKLWFNLMLDHKQLDREYFSNVENNIDSYKSEVKNALDRDDEVVFLFVEEDETKGYVTASIKEGSPYGDGYNRIRFCEIGDIKIEKDSCGKGIGALLLNKVKEWAKERNTSRIELMVFAKNNKASNFFERQGFEPIFHRLSLTF